MCGICGIAYTDQRPVPADRLVHMRDSLAHRGPDGAGTWCEGSVGLGHRRLSIVDVEGGAQPMSNEDGAVVVTFNGEIYNYRELAADLKARGHRFRTRSDTEVLVHGYEEYGTEIVGRLNGIFAFAIYDAVRERLILFRDHLGVKPLYFLNDERGLFFASEIRAVLAGSGNVPRARRAGLQEYLIFRHIVGSETFIEGVKRLPPGHFAVWQRGQLSVNRYWHIPVSADSRGISMEEAAAGLGEHLHRAVEMQLMSDVPLGSFCSGGVDSGLITAHASKLRQDPLDTFSVAFEDPVWDETTLAGLTAARFGTRHHVTTLATDTFHEIFRQIIRADEEPLSHPNTLGLFQVSKLAREHVTVVLTGEGADELFGGYPRYQVARGRHAVRWLPAPVARGLGALAGTVRDHRVCRIADALRYSPEDAILYNSAYAPPALVAALTGSDISAALSERRAMLALSRGDGSPVNWLSRYELLTYLGSALDRMDRVSMAHGLEARVPFLDVSLVEWALRLPGTLRIRGLHNKRVVKAVASRVLPTPVVSGRKSGFGLPLDDWFRSPRADSLLSRLKDPAHAIELDLDPKVLARIIADHAARRTDYGELLWLLSNYSMWHDDAVARAWSDDRRAPIRLATAAN